MIIVVMGVSGSGKTTVGKALTSALEIPFYDADDFHKQLNIVKMEQGIPLQDRDRKSWLVNRYFGLTERQTLQTWTMLTVILGLTGFSIALILSMVICLENYFEIKFLCNDLACTFYLYPDGVITWRSQFNCREIHLTIWRCIAIEIISR